MNDQKICPIGLVRRAGGDGKALRLDSLQSTVLAELIRKELRRLRDFEFQGHVNFTSTCSTGFLPVNFQAALGQMQPNTILTLPSNGGLIDINKYIYDTKSEYHCQTSMTPRCASKLTTKLHLSHINRSISMFDSTTSAEVIARSVSVAESW